MRRFILCTVTERHYGLWGLSRMYWIFPPDFFQPFQAPTRFPTSCFRRSVGGIAVWMQINIIYVCLKDPVLTLEEPLVLRPSYNTNLIRYISHRRGIFMKSATAQVFDETGFFHDIRFHLCLSVTLAANPKSEFYRQAKTKDDAHLEP